MKHWEAIGKSDEWYTPQYIFEALGVHFDLDVAHPAGEKRTPCDEFISADSLSKDWSGFVWMNPPFGGRNGLIPWLDKFFEHGNGIALTPDRSSSAWFQSAIQNADAVLLVSGRVRFIKPDGLEGKSPTTGTALFASGDIAVRALLNAEKVGLGVVLTRPTVAPSPHRWATITTRTTEEVE